MNVNFSPNGFGMFLPISDVGPLPAGLRHGFAPKGPACRTTKGFHLFWLARHHQSMKVVDSHSPDFQFNILRPASAFGLGSL